MFSKFFIDRPIFAAVLSIVITLTGAISLNSLALAQYPQITPATVQVDCNYPGASAQVVAESVAAPIEQQVNGVEDMLYMSSACTNDGSYTLTVTFKLGVDLNVAQVLVQNRLNLALPQLPDVVKQTGVNTKKRSPDILLVAALTSPSGRYDQLYLSNYALLHIREELARLPGISEVFLFGQRDYSMRVWVDPERMAMRNLTASDVTNALREQNVQVALGHLAQPPVRGTEPTQLTLTTLGRLSEPEQFENVVIKALPTGQVIRVKDVARVELGPKSQDISNRFNGSPSVGLAIFQLPDANALDTADRVKDRMKELAQDFPEGVQYGVSYDTTPFIRESIHEVFVALRDAIILVAIVVLVFLQNWRSALIPLIAVPVAIIGTFAVMAAVGFSLNNLTLFGLVLAIGIVVDDAIVVVEAVEHHIEHGLAPRDATMKAMDEVSGPVIAVGLVLSAVFIPCAFMAGIVGQFFRQFALTIAISTIISAFNSLTLSPALAALLLRPKKGQRRDPLTWSIDLLLGWFFRLFNLGFRASTRAYVGLVRRSLGVAGVVLAGYGALLGLTYVGVKGLPLDNALFRRSMPGLVHWAREDAKIGSWSLAAGLPTGFIPAQDKGYLLASVQLPDASSAERTQAVMKKMERIALGLDGVEPVGGVAYTNAVAGNSFLLSAYGSNFGSMFIILDDSAKRRTPDRTSDAILARLRQRFDAEIPEATIAIFGPPAVSGLGRAGGFKIMMEDRGDIGPVALQKQTENFIEKSKELPELGGMFTVFRANAPQLYADINRSACLTQGVDIADVNSTLQIYLGSLYVNDFNRFGRTWQVVVQADARFRRKAEDVRKLMVRNNKGAMVPLGSVCTVRESNAPLVLTRYNMYLAAGINGSSSPGVSTGETIDALHALAGRELPASMSFEWTEIAYLELLSGNTGMLVFALSSVFVFLVLAAQYESWSLPLAVILVVPMCVLSSVIGVALAKQDINIFTQVGFVVLIGLACKNAILIVEFAKAKREEGASTREATLQACELRLRPIMMTSFAFIFGVLPLVIAKGAGAEMRQALGTAVFSGMLGVTLFGIFLTPVFFFVIEGMSESSLFQTRRARLLGLVARYLMVALTLGLSLVLMLLFRELRRRARPVIAGLGPQPPGPPAPPLAPPPRREGPANGQP